MSPKEAIEYIRKFLDVHGKDLNRVEKEMKSLIKKGQQSGDLFLMGVANYYLAAANYRYGGERNTVLLYAIKATAMLDKTTEYELTARSYNLLGIAYISQNNYQLALEAYNHAYDIVKKHRVKGTIGRTLKNNIADCYFQMGDYKLSIKLFSGCLANTRKNAPEDRTSIAIYSINLSDSYKKLGDHERAKDILLGLRDWIEDLDESIWVCYYFSSLACNYYALGDKANGDVCSDKVFGIMQRDVYTYEYNIDVEEITHVLVCSGDFERAKRFADMIYEYAEKSGNTIDRQVACRVMAEYYSKLGDTARSLEIYEELVELYKQRAEEMKAIQLNIHRKITEADREIKGLNRKIRASEESAMRDPLTRLLNRSALLSTTTEFIEIAEKNSEKIGGIFIDIDFFKQCNDTYGHAVGDEIIKEVARRCAAEESAHIKFARYGGDEFFGIMHGLKDDQVIAIAQRICRTISREQIPNANSPGEKHVTLSVGVINTRVAERSNTIIDIVNYADKALYHAKRTGKDAIYLFDRSRIGEDEESDPYVRFDY
ncbi:MAG: GGDEF domain-containing protein [Clostridia bacterium]|nr:GGDEF domain-containing protein [Clostridia bacterium]